MSWPQEQNRDVPKDGDAGGTPYERLRDALRGFPVAEVETAQVGRGPATRLCWRSIGRDLVLWRGRVVPKVTTHIRWREGWVVVTLPISCKGDLRYNGRLAEANDLFMSVGADGYTQTFERRDSTTVAIRLPRFRAACAALANLPGEEIALRDLVVNLGPGAGEAMHRLVLSALERSVRRQAGPEGGGLTRGEESEVLAALIRILLPRLMKSEAAQAASTHAVEVYRAARRALGDPTRRVTVAELCEAANVKEAWLHRCFQEVCGTSAARYAKCRRLSAVRDSLLDPDSPPRSVKDVALAHDFTESGRFAAEYRALFLENPSETLRRAQR